MKSDKARQRKTSRDRKRQEKLCNVGERQSDIEKDKQWQSAGTIEQREEKQLEIKITRDIKRLEEMSTDKQRESKAKGDAQKQKETGENKE